MVAVEGEQVDVPGAEPLERRRHRAEDARAPEAGSIRMPPDLRGDDDPLALRMPIQPGTDHDLAASARVVVGGADERASGGMELVEDIDRGLEARSPAEDRAVDAVREHADAGRAELPGDRGRG